MSYEGRDGCVEHVNETDDVTCELSTLNNMENVFYPLRLMCFEVCCLNVMLSEIFYKFNVTCDKVWHCDRLNDMNNVKDVFHP